MIGRLRSSSFALELENPAKTFQICPAKPSCPGPWGPWSQEFLTEVGVTDTFVKCLFRRWIMVDLPPENGCFDR